MPCNISQQFTPKNDTPNGSHKSEGNDTAAEKNLMQFFLVKLLKKTKNCDGLITVIGLQVF